MMTFTKKTFNQLEPGDTIYYLRNHELIKIYITEIGEFNTGGRAIYGRRLGTDENFSIVIDRERVRKAVYNNNVFSNIYELVKNREEEIKDLKELIQEFVCEGKYTMLNLMISEVKAEKRVIKSALL